ncbi:MAG TPA: DUF1501 domain-containing protein [Pyrinomonadaceae bacterium]|nr:DUF1501 domain-containing protein [Pyrinomonadaceae bacterium]
MAQSRRKFLQQTGCALTGAALISSLEQFSMISAFAQQADVASDYKALVCIFMSGGNDCNNTIVPLDSEYNTYSTVRNASGLALSQQVLLPVTPITSGRSFGLHPNLSPEVANPTTTFKGLLDLWNQQKVAALCNVGTLVQPLTRTQYQSGIGRPYQLFSHSDQVAQQQASISNNPSQTGWGGRVADFTGALNGSVALPMNVSVAGTSLFATGQSSRQLAISPAPTTLNQVLVLTMSGGAAADQTARRNTFTQLLGFDLDRALIKASSDNTSQALQTSAALSTDPTVGAFPNTSLGNQLKQVAKLIKLRDTLGMKRQIFFCSLGGFDTHTQQTGSNPTSTTGGAAGSGNQGSLMFQLSTAMRAFYDETVAQNIQNNVVTFTLSDFGRTFQPSGSGSGTVGSDHAWGNHAFIMGGAVHGGDFYGRYPTLALGGPDDTDNRGRWIPSTSIDQYAATLASWYGLAQSDMPTVFPFLSRFSPSNLGFLG